MGQGISVSCFPFAHFSSYNLMARGRGRNRTWLNRNPRMAYWLHRSEYHPVMNPAPITNPLAFPGLITPDPQPGPPNPKPVPPNPEYTTNSPPPLYPGNESNANKPQSLGLTTKPLTLSLLF